MLKSSIIGSTHGPVAAFFLGEFSGKLAPKALSLSILPLVCQGLIAARQQKSRGTC
jgi:hypothetical protein